MVLGKTFGNSVTVREILSGVPLKLLALQNGHAHQMGTATGSETGVPSKMEVVRTLPNHDIPREQGTELVVVRTVVIADSVKNLAYPYTFHTNDEVSTALGDMFASGLYAWNFRVSSPLSTSLGSRPGL